MRPLILGVAFALLAAGVLPAAPGQTGSFFPVEDVRPGMVGIGRTVFSGDELAEFSAHIVGVLRNALGPQQDLILARLAGGPLAHTGVIQGMSGSPVYIDGRLVGAVSYALGSFAKEPLAGITPIQEMTTAVTGAPVERMRTTDLALSWPADREAVFATLGRLAARAAAPLGTSPGTMSVLGPAALGALAPELRPIGAAMILGGFDPAIGSDVRQALSPVGVGQDAAPDLPGAEAPGALRPGDPIGMSLVRGDLQLGATGTVTHIEGSQVYAFGHPFLNLGPTSFSMTRARVFTVLPSLASSFKIAALGPVIGTMTQDRATAVGGVMGPAPPGVDVHLTLESARAPARRFNFDVLQDPELTALFTYVAVLNSLSAYERQNGALSVAVSGAVSFGDDGEVAFDDVFSGVGAAASAAGAVTTPIGRAIANEFRPVMPTRVDLTIRTSEREEFTTIERAWLDTTRPLLGGTHMLQVQLQDYRGEKRTVSLPVTMPTQADGPVTLLVSNGAELAELEAKDLRPGRPANWADLRTELASARRGNRLYVRLLTSSTGTVVAGDTLPALPASVRSVLDTDTTVARTAITRSVAGAWERRLDLAVRGSRELTFTLTSP